MDVANLKRVCLVLIEEDNLLLAHLERDGPPRLSQLLAWDQRRRETLFEAIELGQEQINSGNKFETEGVIFAVCPTWVDEQGALLEVKKNWLRQVCQKFSFRPLGFLTDVEVFSRYFEELSGDDSSDSFINVFAGKDSFLVSLMHLGKIKGAAVYRGRHLNSAIALAEAIESFDFPGVLPPWLLVWGVPTEGLESELLAYPWTEKKIFLHLPEITVLGFAEACERFSKVIFSQSEETVKSDVLDISEPVQDSDFGFGFEDFAKEVSRSEEVGKETVKDQVPILPTENPTPKILVEKKGRTSFRYSFLTKFRLLIDKVKDRSIGLPRKTWVYGLVVIPFFVLLGGLIFWYLGRVNIEIYLSPQEVRETLVARLDPEAKSFDVDKGVIPVETAELVLEGTKEAVSTGEKTVGERATGKTKIYNRTNKPQSFKEGTVLTGPSGLKFNLSTDILVASKSADLTSGVDKWGEVSADVSAAQIGAEYNLASGSILSLADFSRDSFLAKSENSFSGGTSRKIRAISQQDQDGLKNRLKEEFLATAKDRFLSEGSDSGKVFPESIKLEVVEEKYIGDVGEEREDLSLSLKVRAISYRISKRSLEDLASRLLARKLETGLEVMPGSLKAEMKIDEEKQKALIGQLTVGGRAYPRLNLEELSESLRGKTEREAGEIIRSYPRVYRYQINFSPEWMGVFSRLPSRERNISIETKDQNGTL